MFSVGKYQQNNVKNSSSSPLSLQGKGPHLLSLIDQVDLTEGRLLRKDEEDDG